jgi:hypothetical protein
MTFALIINCYVEVISSIKINEMMNWLLSRREHENDLNNLQILITI